MGFMILNDLGSRTPSWFKPQPIVLRAQLAQLKTAVVLASISGSGVQINVEAFDGRFHVTLDKLPMLRLVPLRMLS